MRPRLPDPGRKDIVAVLRAFPGAQGYVVAAMNRADRGGAAPVYDSLPEAE